MLQVLTVGAVVAAGFLLGPDWDEPLRGLALAGGGALLAAGVGLGIVGVRDLGPSLTPLPRPADGARLVERGVYSRIRHPIYLGVILSAVGWALVTASIAAILLSAALTALLDLKARREEAWLHDRYAAYGDYARRTRRFVPGIY